MKTATITFLITFISVFIYSEIGSAFTEREVSGSNDYCLILIGADLTLTKSTDSIPLKLKSESILSLIHYTEQNQQNLYYIFPNKSNRFLNKTSVIYLYDCTFLI